MTAHEPSPNYHLPQEAILGCQLAWHPTRGCYLWEPLIDGSYLNVVATYSSGIRIQHTTNEVIVDAASSYARRAGLPQLQPYHRTGPSLLNGRSC